MKTIIFDVDGVLADFIYGFTKELGLEPWSHTQQKTWNVDMDLAAINSAWGRIKNSSLWWCDLPSLVSQETFDRINGLHATNQVVFCTNRVGQAPQGQTVDWLSAHGIFRPSVILSKRKGDVAQAIDADFSIEDKPENAACVHWIADGCKSYIIDRPYNRVEYLPQRVKRVLTLEEFLDDVEASL